MKIGKLLLFMFAIMTLNSCGVRTKLYEFNYPTVQNTFTINAPYDEVWSKVIDIFAENNIKIDVIEKESGIITSGRTEFPTSYYIDNQLVNPNAYIAVQFVSNYKKDGTGLKAESSWNVRVKKIDDKTTSLSVNLSTPVITAYTATAVGMYGIPTGYNWVPQNLQAKSTGKFENIIYEQVK